MAGESGSGGITGLAVIGVLCALLVAIAPIGGALSARQHLQGAADAAALAAADTASGRVAGSPCDAASGLAGALGVSLSDCGVDPSGRATVRVSATVLGVSIDASARAGPPELR
ncbi:pilus assembly protein TadG-related protein [Herbiconiux sp. CPCC 205763]|uniref:Pilus assembly protein TadG-related protein n=1 Tax=Herbiconiux aconitum TaxID=2970913 RepID=A0ABT2GKM5_9MICO|nr:Rv3654c family TadE-like protein [Herbiconiux aconitum]MCS5716723.1 pilus assembly protein TadG-related protein [Herbiconiux aconitum]